MAFYRVSTVFMVEILCALTVLHCASTALQAHAPRFRACAGLENCVRWGTDFLWGFLFVCLFICLF